MPYSRMYSLTGAILQKHSCTKAEIRYTIEISKHISKEINNEYKKTIKPLQPSSPFWLEIGIAKSFIKKEYLIQTPSGNKGKALDKRHLFKCLLHESIIVLWLVKKTYKVRISINHPPNFRWCWGVCKKWNNKTSSHLLNKMQQNRTVIVLQDETIMKSMKQ
jgi:hypothetical protein